MGYWYWILGVWAFVVLVGLLVWSKLDFPKEDGPKN